MRKNQGKMNKAVLIILIVVGVLVLSIGCCVVTGIISSIAIPAYMKQKERLMKSDLIKTEYTVLYG